MCVSIIIQFFNGNAPLGISNKNGIEVYFNSLIVELPKGRIDTRELLVLRSANVDSSATAHCRF
jgi:hypothetical protein